MTFFNISRVLLVAACCFILSGWAHAETLASSFELQDQFKKTHRVEFPVDRVSVLALADRAGSEQLNDWIGPLYKKYGETINIHGVAKLAGVPRPLRGMLRALFRKSLEYPVMLDWSGDVSTAYTYEAQVANVLVVSPKGRIEYRFNGKANPEALKRCFERIDALAGTSSPDEE